MRYWKDNPHWMVREADGDPLFDPRAEGCDGCGWIDERGIAHSDVIWNRVDGSCIGGSTDPNGVWLCMECD
jgi:hypothetical protein